MESVEAAAAVLGGNTAEETMAVESMLMASTVEHQTFESLRDIVTEQNLDMEGAFIPETLEMANNTCDEQWRMQWDAVINLRILNKFHYRVFEGIVDQVGNFVKGQIENLRSNNSRNALALFCEVFTQNADQCPEGRKTNDTWSVFIDLNMTSVFKNVIADKKFLQLVAQKAILATCEVSPIPQTSAVLVLNASSKSMPLAEFAVRSLEVLVKSSNPALFHEPHHEEQCLQIVHCLCQVLDQKQMKKVKYAKPTMQHIQTFVGGADQLKQLCLKAYNYTKQQEQTEEVKETAEQAAADQAKLEAKINLVVDSLTVKKAAPKAGGLRSFMKTAKNDIKEMQMAVDEPVVAAAATSDPFAASVALPKSSGGILSSDMVETSQAMGDVDPSPSGSMELAPLQE